MANAKTAFSYSLLANKFAAWTTNSVGSVYESNVCSTGGQEFNIRIVYTDGLLRLTAPSNDFGSDLNAEFTGNQSIGRLLLVVRHLSY